MKVSELTEKLAKVDQDADVICVVYTADSYESGYVDDIHSQLKYNSVTGKLIDEDESVVELVTSTRGK